MRNKNIIVLGQQDWESSIGSNNINIAKEFAKHNRVLYVNNAPDRNTVRKNKNDPFVAKKLSFVRGGENGIEQAEPNLWVLYPSVLLESINWLPKSILYSYLNKRNNKRLAKCIKKAAIQLGFDEFLVFNDSLISKAYHLKEMLKPSFYIYYSRDNFSGIPYFQKHAVQEEKEIVRKADLVVANSGQLAQIAKKHNPNAHNIGQGCDLSLYDPQQAHIAEDVAAIPRPIIGYTGYLTALRLDEELLLFAAKAKPEWHFALIGPEDEVFRSSDLHQLPNVHFLGNKKPDELGQYIQAFDVAINPQLVNDLTKGNYPRKIDEYLAMGKPVVATKTDFMEFFEKYCHLSHDKDSFLNCLANALTEGKNETLKAERIAFAQEHSWEKNVEKIYALVEATLDLRRK